MDLLEIVRGELRAWSGHWAAGHGPLAEKVVRHDRRMADKSCCTCAILELLDQFLEPPHPAVMTAVVPRGEGEPDPARLRRPGHDRPAGVQLSRPRGVRPW